MLNSERRNHHEKSHNKWQIIKKITTETHKLLEEMENPENKTSALTNIDMHCHRHHHHHQLLLRSIDSFYLFSTYNNSTH